MTIKISLSEFLEPFFPAADEPIYLFGFSPKEMPPDKRLPEFKRQTNRQQISGNQLFQNNLLSENKQKGLYFTVNSGGTKIAEINRINAVFCEIDDRPFDEQHDLFDNCDFPPSIRVETKKSVHAYWLLNEQLTIEQFASIQRGLITKFGSDEKIKNPNRLMRLPHFNHVAWTENGYQFKRVEIHTFCPEAHFNYAELVSAFPPPAEPPKPKYEKLETIKGRDLQAELRARVLAHSTCKVESSRQWATCQGICHAGKGNTAIAVNLVSGYVHCQKGCTFEQLLNAFGLELPKKKSFALMKRREQKSQTYQWLKQYVESK